MQRYWSTETSDGVKEATESGTEKVVLGVNNLDDSIAMFRKAYGWAEPITETQKDFGKLAYFPGEPVILAAPFNGGWLSDRLGKFGESPVAYLLATPDFAAAPQKYKLNGTKHSVGHKGAWLDARKLQSRWL